MRSHSSIAAEESRESRAKHEIRVQLGVHGLMRAQDGPTQKVSRVVTLCQALEVA